MISLETHRLTIREIKEKDIEVLHKIYTHKETMQYISSGKYDWTPEELRNKYENINKDYSSGSGIFAVELKEISTVIGEAGLFNSFNDNKIMELGYILEHTYWKKGLGTEICYALIKYCKKKLQTEKVIARMYAENTASVRLSEALGMIRTEIGQTPQGKTFYRYEINTKQ